MTLEWVPPVIRDSASGSGSVSEGHFDALFSKEDDHSGMDVDGPTKAFGENPHQDVAFFLASRIVDGAGEVSRQSAEDFLRVSGSRVEA